MKFANSFLSRRRDGGNDLSGAGGIGDIPVVCATEHVSKRCKQAVGIRIGKVLHLETVSEAELMEFDRMLSRCRYCEFKRRVDDPVRVHRALREILPKLLAEAEADAAAEKFLRSRLETVTESFFLLNGSEFENPGEEAELLLDHARKAWLGYLSKGIPQKSEETPE